MTHLLSLFQRSALAAVLALMPLGAAQAQQGQFAPAIIVNDSAITAYEIDQRAKLLALFRTPGASETLAREQLIEDRLKQEEMNRAGLRLTDEGLASALNDFAARANLTPEQFNAILAQNGVAPETLRDFVSIGVSWRDFIRTRFARQGEISDAEVDRALGQGGSGSGEIEVLLSEIIIPAPPPRAASALATATQIAQTRSTETFSARARQVSALPSRNNGGRLGWLPITNYPPQLRTVILGLATGEVTDPIQIPNGVALFQMRGVREVRTPSIPPSAIEYAAYYVAGGQAEARRVADRIDTCDDLYGIAQGQPADVLERDSLAPSDIPQDVAFELAKLDPGEVSYALTRANGATTVLLMLCNRVTAAAEGASRDGVRNQLRSRRLGGYADALLADLRASATIITR